MAFPGLGTVVNVGAVIIGALLGLAIGHRLPARTQSVVTDCLGLATLLMAGLSCVAVTSSALADSVGGGAAVLIVVGALLIGSIAGSLLRIEQRIEGIGSRLQALFARRQGTQPSGERERFVEGWLTTSLLFCVGPLTILGTLSDGLGRGIDQLLLKSVLDGFAAIAFAASFGVGVLMSAASVAVIQGGLTLVGVLLGSIMPAAHIDALTATGGVILAGIALRLLRVKEVAVGDMLPALIVAPLLTQLVHVLR